MQGTSNSIESILIITHELFYGAPQALLDHVNKKKIKNVYFVSHPIHKKNTYSRCIHFQNGKKIKSLQVKRLLPGTVFQYVFDVFVSAYFFIHIKHRLQLVVAVDPLNYLAVHALSLFRKIRRKIFYSIDFVPKRFSSKFLNALYHSIEKFAVKNSDICWDVSPRIADGRAQFLDLKKGSYTHIVVPIGVWKKDIKKPTSTITMPPTVVFVGHILEKQGVQLVIKSFEQVKKSVKNAKLLVIGGGSYLPELKILAKKLDLEKHITFTGWIGDQGKVQSLLAKGAIGTALYKSEGRDTGNFSWYADPTKLKTYLSAGLPVICTSVPHNAKDLKKNMCGFVVSYDKKAVANTLISYLKDTKLQKQYKKNAYSYILQFEWDTIFETALQKSV